VDQAHAQQAVGSYDLVILKCLLGCAPSPAAGTADAQTISHQYTATGLSAKSFMHCLMMTRCTVLYVCAGSQLVLETNQDRGVCDAAIIRVVLEVDLIWLESSGGSGRLR
jgi:hypothetical protein